MKVAFHAQDDYDCWLATNPDFAKVTEFRAYNLPMVKVLPDLPACTKFWADEHLHRLRVAKMIEVKKTKEGNLI